MQGHIISNPVLEDPAVFNSKTVCERTYSKLSAPKASVIYVCAVAFL